jgi:hypothetical protein
MKNNTLETLVAQSIIRKGVAIKALFHKSASADLRSHADRQMRSENGQFASIAGEVSDIKQTSTGLQVIIRRTDGEKPYGSLTSNQTLRHLVVNATEVML